MIPLETERSRIEKTPKVNEGEDEHGGREWPGPRNAAARPFEK